MQSSPSTRSDLLRHLPQVDKLLQQPGASQLLAVYPRNEVVRALRDAVEALRQEIRTAPAHDESPGAPLAALTAKLEPAAIFDEAAARLRTRELQHYRRVINATGVILHTGLGRAVLAEAAVDALTEALRGYTLVEVDAETGDRNRREAHLADILCELTGAEAATVVNNNAAATLIILAALARGHGVIISRGQLVEIGGSYRIPDILEESGARLVEVGTTNRTYIDDYRKAITPDTGLLLRVHTSNYEIAGFACQTPLDELVSLGNEHGIPVVSDLGSGCFVDLVPYGFRHEPLVSDSVRAGADVVCFSGDKLLGGPQAGVIVGKRQPIEQIRRHPLFRAMRIDKMTLVALEATLKLYRNRARLAETLPALRMIATPVETVRQRAQAFCERLRGSLPDLEIEAVEDSSQAGSGSLPTQELPTWAVSLRVERLPAHGLAAELRARRPPIFTRVRSDTVLLDFRTILPEDEASIEQTLEAILK